MEQRVVYLSKFDDNQPRDEHGRWTDGGGGEGTGMEMVSPNIRENLTMDEAISELSGTRAAEVLEASKAVDSIVGMLSDHMPAIGAWADGAENSIIVRINEPTTYEKIETSAAMKGMLADQKAVIPFHVHAGGQDAMYSISVPSSDLKGIHDELQGMGIEYHTLQPAGDSTTVWIFDKGTEIGDRVVAAGARYGSTPKGWQGTGNFLGGDTRAEGRAAYEEVIRRNLGSDQQRQWDGLYRRWRETHPEAKAQRVAGALDLIERFNEDQPRDEHGRWTSTGGGSSSGTGGAGRAPRGEAGKTGSGWKPTTPSTLNIPGNFEGEVTPADTFSFDERDKLYEDLRAKARDISTRYNNGEISAVARENAMRALSYTSYALMGPERGEGSGYLLALSKDGQLRGGALFAVNKDRESAELKWLGSLQRGAGRELLARFENEAKREGAKYAFLTSTDFAEKFYEAHGYELVDRWQGRFRKVLEDKAMPTVTRALEDDEEPLGMLAATAEARAKLEAYAKEHADDFGLEDIEEEEGDDEEKAARRKFNPDQPRDELGRWADDGGGGSGSNDNPASSALRHVESRYATDAERMAAHDAIQQQGIAMYEPRDMAPGIQAKVQLDPPDENLAGTLMEHGVAAGLANINANYPTFAEIMRNTQFVVGNFTKPEFKESYAFTACDRQFGITMALNAAPENIPPREMDPKFSAVERAAEGIYRVTADAHEMNRKLGEAVLYHELGHALDISTGNAISRDLKIVAMRGARAEGLKTPDYIEKHLGNYASNSPEEAMAELTAHAMLGHSIPPAFRDLATSIIATGKTPTSARTRKALEPKAYEIVKPDEDWMEGEDDSEWDDIEDDDDAEDKSQPVIAKYSDDQPRDEAGRWTDGSGSSSGSSADKPAKFDRQEWIAKPMNEARAEWARLSTAEQDALARPTESIPNRIEQITGGKATWANTGDARNDIADRVGQFRGESLTSDGARLIADMGQKTYDRLREAGADKDAARELAMLATDHLIAQEVEAMGRTLGDHGIHHLSENARISSEILNAAGVTDSESHVALMLAAAFHDSGYLTEPSRAFLDSKHPRWSAQHYQENLRGPVEAAFGKDFADNLASMIYAHDDTEMDWDRRPLQAAFSTADNLSLFHFEKMPGMLRYVPENLGTLVALGRGNIDAQQAQTIMRANIDRSNLPSGVKSRLRDATHEVTGVLPKYTLGMVGVRLSRVEWRKDHPKITLRRYAANEALGKVLDLGQKQFAKLAETYGADPKQFVSSGHLGLERGGKTLLELDIANKDMADIIVRALMLGT